MTSQQLLRAASVGCVALAVTTTACARAAQDTKSPSPAPVARRITATVFTDSALYKQVCTESDSGLTMRTNRCTPRDQGVTLRKP